MCELKLRPFWILIAVLSIGVAGFALNRVYSHGSHDSRTDQNQVENPQRTTAAAGLKAIQHNPKGSSATALPIALRVNGFAPDEITRPAGNFLFSITNLTTLPDLTFLLQRANGERLQSAKVQKEKRSWRQYVRLTPGDYLLTVMDHPEWTCRITITAQ